LRDRHALVGFAMNHRERLLRRAERSYESYAELLSAKQTGLPRSSSTNMTALTG
jgi:hypothetical protein